MRRRTVIFVPLVKLRVQSLRQLVAGQMKSRQQPRPHGEREQQKLLPPPSRRQSRRRRSLLRRRRKLRLLQRRNKFLLEDSRTSLFRDGGTGSLRGLSRPGVFKRIHQIRDSILSIKRYFYRRCMSGAYLPSSESRKTRFIDRLRLWAWMQPVGCFKPSKTEVYYLNSRPLENIPSGCGNPAIFFPTPKRAWELNEKPAYAGLLKRITRKACFPVQLLVGLLGKSSIEHSASLSLPE
jgi:hypothetical protein